MRVTLILNIISTTLRVHEGMISCVRANRDAHASDMKRPKTCVAAGTLQRAAWVQLPGAHCGYESHIVMRHLLSLASLQLFWLSGVA